MNIYDEIDTVPDFQEKFGEWGDYSNQYPMDQRYHLFYDAINNLLMSEVWHRMIGILRLISFSVRWRAIETFDSAHKLFRKLLTEYFPL